MAVPTESDEQAILCAWLDARGLVYAANQEGRRWAGSEQERWKQVAAAKRRGLKAGRPDIEIYTPPANVSCRGVAVELKSTRQGAKMTEAQTEWLRELQRCGWLVRVCKGADEAIAWLTEVYPR